MAKTEKSYKVSVTVPFYKGEKYIENCIQSILKNSYPVYRIYIVDNSPVHFDFTEILKSNECIKILKAKPSIGYGRACNLGVYQGIQEACDYCIILNQDAILESDCISQLLLPFGRDPSIVASTPQHLTYDLKSVIEKSYKQYVLSNKTYIEDLKNNKLTYFYEIDFNQTNGSCIAFRANYILEMGLFDPLFPHYGEDDDLLIRLSKEFKKKIVFCPKAIIGHEHTHFSSTGKERDKIEAYVHLSQQLIYLKDTRYSVFRGFALAIGYSIKSYGKALVHGKIFRIFLFIKEDWKFLLKIPSAVRHRNHKILIKEIDKFLKMDGC